MNAALHSIFEDMTAVLQKVCDEPRMSEVYDWERTQTPRLYRYMERGMGFYHISKSPSDRLSDVKTRLDNAIRRERLKLQQRHWSFDAFRLEAFATAKSVIEKYEWDMGIA